MKKHFLPFIVLMGLMAGPFCQAQQEQKPNAKTMSWRGRVQNWQTAFKDRAAYEKEVWLTKGLPAARKKLWYKKPLTKKEQLYFNALKKRVVGGTAGILTLLAIVYGLYEGKKIISQRELEEEMRREFVIPGYSEPKVLTSEQREELIEKRREERELEDQKRKQEREEREKQIALKQKEKLEQMEKELKEGEKELELEYEKRKQEFERREELIKQERERREEEIEQKRKQREQKEASKDSD